MLKLPDAMLLARSKIRAHKIWFIIVIVIEALLLAIVFLLIGVSKAVEDDLATYSSNSLSGKFLVRASSPQYASNSELNSKQEILDLADELYAEDIAKRTELARQFGIEFYDSGEDAPTEYVEGERVFKPWTKYGQMAIEDYIANLGLDTSAGALRSKLVAYDHKLIYEWHSMVADGAIIQINDGEEDFSQYKSAVSASEESMLDGFQVLDDDVYDEFVTEDFAIDDEAIPIVASVENVKRYFDIEDELTYEEILAQVVGKEIKACYRNEASRQLIFSALQEENEYGINYDKPTVLCGEALIRSDNRSEIEKENAAKQLAFQKALGEYEAPRQQLLSFKIVGVIPTSDGRESGSDLYSFIKDLGEINISTPIIPRSYYDANKVALGEIFRDYSELEDIRGIANGYLIEFYDSRTAIRFIENESCADNNKGCLDKNKAFYFSFDNKSVILANISELVEQVILLATIGVVVIAIITTMTIILRSINSEKKEISIYKAIGFGRRHITQIYFTQTAMISVIIVVIAALLAFSTGAILNVVFSESLRLELTEIFSIYNQTLEAVVFSIDISMLLSVVAVFLGSTIFVGLITAYLLSNKNIVAGLRYE